MKARGKRKAQRSASPLGYRIKALQALKGRNTDISAFQALSPRLYCNQGRRALRLPLAFIFRAVGAGLLISPTFEAMRVMTMPQYANDW
jgi:hypothetical protein